MQAAKAVEDIEQSLGAIDLLVCNAGCSYPGTRHAALV